MCTGIIYKTNDNSVIYGRTLEFGLEEFHSNIIVIPRNYEYFGHAPDLQSGLSWKCKYGFVAASICDSNNVTDGLNEKGLSFGSFYFTNYADYMNVEQNEYHKSLSQWELGAWILGNFKTVNELKTEIEKINVVENIYEELGRNTPLHYVVTDKDGYSIVIEYIDGKLNIHNNTVGVITNAPDFKWHLTNIENYIGLSAFNPKSTDIFDHNLSYFGEGFGLIGMPGDFSPPSRFVRAFIFTQTMLPGKNANDGVFKMFHLLNNFDIPKGSVRGSIGNKNVLDYTVWTSVCDQKNLRYFYKTYENGTVKYVDLKDTDFNYEGAKSLPMVNEKDKLNIEKVTIKSPTH
ncbi:MAG: choloylglycine hydrolase family protein [bacterium]|nr:choloylglycine hydrolase family protein [bacterium]